MAGPRQVGFVETLGIHEVVLSPGVVRCDLTATEAHRNIQGVVHGSVLVALLDTAMGHALSGTLTADEFCSTTQFSVQFLKASRPGDRLAATGKITRRGSRIAYMEGTCVDGEGAEIARAHGTWYVGRLSERR